MRILQELARFMVGGLFIFSGAIKVNDPIGTAIKLEEYFEVFAYDIAPFFEIFVPAALFLSVFLSVLEIVLGIALLIGYRVNLTSWVLLLMIVFFTFLTFYSAYFNKVTDCGCFGDAIKLTPWQSFYKDIILLVLIVFIFRFRKKIPAFLSEKVGMITVAASTLIFVVVAITAIRHLPFIDFRTYAIGNNIPELMLPSGELEYAYIMEKDGKEYSFPTYPTDKSYKFISLDVLNPEVQPKITDLSVWNDDGEYTEELLSGQKLVAIMYNTDKTDIDNLEDMKTLFLSVKGVETWILTASGPEQFESFRHEHQIATPYFFADATVLKTIVRSNPGFILLNNGIVLGKWHHNDTPSASEIHRIIR
ncbi:MAG: DoxX family protein [Cytophagales bacterium]|nr:DoxX family protein [Cytophagales bacterium]